MAIAPAPYEWHDASKFLPNEGEIVRVHQLYGWAEHRGGKWVYVDQCGNRSSLDWQPEFWRREYYPVEPALAVVLAK